MRKIGPLIIFGLFGCQQMTEVKQKPEAIIYASVLNPGSSQYDTIICEHYKQWNFFSLNFPLGDHDSSSCVVSYETDHSGIFGHAGYLPNQTIIKFEGYGKFVGQDTSVLNSSVFAAPVINKDSVVMAVDQINGRYLSPDALITAAKP